MSAFTDLERLPTVQPYSLHELSTSQPPALPEAYRDFSVISNSISHTSRSPLLPLFQPLPSVPQVSYLKYGTATLFGASAEMFMCHGHFNGRPKKTRNKQNPHRFSFTIKMLMLTEMKLGNWLESLITLRAQII